MTEGLVLLTSDNAPLSGSKLTPSVAAIPASVSIDESVLRYVRASTARNTQRAYQSDLRHFLAWGGSIPAAEASLAQYLAAHATSHSIATLERRLCAISRAHAALGHPSPSSSHLVRLTLRGIRRVHGRPQRRVAALLKDDLIAMIEKMDDDLRGKRDRALLLVGFAGAFRRSELVAIDCKDLEETPRGLVITLRRSKTDQEGRGRRVGIPHGEATTCPVAALSNWLSSAEVLSGPVFRPVNRCGLVVNERLSPEAVAIIVKAHAAAAGLDPNRYSGHSLRAGFVTSAATANVPAWKIRSQTGHASEAMLQRYIRNGEPLSGSAADGLL